MSDDDKSGLRVAVLDDASLTLLLAIMRDAGVARGRQNSYQECVDVARERIADKEGELMRIGADAPTEQLVMGEIMALRWFVQQFDEAPAYYNERTEFEARRIAAIAERIREASGLDLSILFRMAAQAGP